MSADPVPDAVPVPVSILVLDHEGAQFGATIDDWHSVIVMACISDDPVSWSEIGEVWPRYQTEHSPEYVDSLAFDDITLDDATARLDSESPWLVIDLPNKRLFGGGDFPQIPRDACLGLGENKGMFGPSIRVSIHLPPWWEIMDDAPLDAIWQPRTSPIEIPDPRRDVLWGPALTKDLAQRVCDMVRNEQWRLDGCDANAGKRYAHTVAVHRDWLMTPRNDLDGRMPRECLHGGMDWIDKVIQGQQHGITSERGPIPIPQELRTCRTGPMGRAEVCMYFDCCRELISFGWEWIVGRNADPVRRENAETGTDVGSGVGAGTGVDTGLVERQLAEALAAHQEIWMRSPFEGDSPPESIILSERRHVPRVAGQDGERHVIDCDCPVCQMMAERISGPTFISFDGHHLELDDEFAFSLWETRRTWELEQAHYREFATAMDAKQVKQETCDEGMDTFASPWKYAHVDWDSMQQGDSIAQEDSTSTVEAMRPRPMVNIAISFLLADMVATLQESCSPQADIDQLNDAFRAYRTTTSGELSRATELFGSALEEVARRNPSLVPKSADLQSKLDEIARVDSMSWD